MQAENDIVEFLEKVKNNGNVEKTDVTILKKADDYNVDLEKLEYPSEKEQARTQTVQQIEEDWQMLDVKLSDVLNAIVDTSERPCFMIRDDKLVYANPAALFFLDADEKILGKKFLDFVLPEDWKILTESIGEMITDGKKQTIRLKSLKKDIKSQEFSAVYLSEIDHFSFILLGEHQPKKQQKKRSELFDELTGLPNFFLFEDRVQTAVVFEKNKPEKEKQYYMAVAAINIENEEMFYKMRIYDNIMKSLANSLVAVVRKTDTIAKGLKYTFWVFLPSVESMQQMKGLFGGITKVLDDGIKDNITRHEIKYSMGISIFPETANSTKELMEQTIFATKKAQANPKKSVEIFRG